MSFNSASYSPKNINVDGNKSPVEDEEIIIIGTTPVISTIISPIRITIVIPQKIVLVEEKIYHNWQSPSYGQSQFATDSSYYQPQPAKYNQRQQYLQDIITQQAHFKNDYDR